MTRSAGGNGTDESPRKAVLSTKVPDLNMNMAAQVVTAAPVEPEQQDSELTLQPKQQQNIL